MSLGNDLSTIRKEKNLSLEDIFEVTKIPVHTLKSIENDTLLKSSSESKTYLRSFIRSYAKALKISDNHILSALKDTEEDRYDNTLLKLIYPERSQSSTGIEKELKSTNDSHEEIVEAYNDTEDEHQIDEASTPKNNLDKESPKPTVSSVNWADMSKKVYASPANSKVGLLLIFILLIGGLGTAGYFYGGDVVSMFSSESDSTESNVSDDPLLSAPDSSLITEDSTSFAGLNDLEDQELNQPVLPDTLTVVLYAAYDKLEPVRITSDLNNRTNPFWMYQGEAYYFDFRDTLRVRGQYSRFLLMYNGNVINNPRQNYFDPALNSIVITRDILSGTEYQNNNSNNFPTNLGVQAPDSIIYRIDF
jgi:transcriptional regulator with XRE-family HTH domain